MVPPFCSGTEVLLSSVSMDAQPLYDRSPTLADGENWLALGAAQCFGSLVHSRRSAGSISRTTR